MVVAMVDHTPAEALGRLSREGESGGDPGIVSTGLGDAGGASYGLYQMTSRPNGGTVAAFVRQSPWAPLFGGAEPGTQTYAQVWKEVARTGREAFVAAQHEYIKRLFYDPLVARILGAGGAVLGRSLAARNVLWALAVGFGPAGAYHSIVAPLWPGGMGARVGDRDVIAAVYAECLKPGAQGVGLAHWGGCSQAVQEGVKTGLLRARKRALDMLENETKET